MKLKGLSNWFIASLTALVFQFPIWGGGQLFGQGHGEPQGHDGTPEEHAAPKEPGIGEFILHHVGDTHDWILTEWDNGNGELKEIGLHLPWILYNTATGLQFFSSTEALSQDPNYLVSHDHVYGVKSKEAVHGISVEEAKKQSDKYVVIEHGGHAEVFEKAEGSVLDFSINKTGLQIFLVAFLMLFMFLSVAKAYKRTEGKAPKGMQSFFEPIILFVRDEVGKPFLKGKTNRFLPYLLTLFFFIWFSNMLGLTPLNSNIAGNISVTLVLALLTLVIILANSTKDFWLHIFWFPGVPVFVKPLMLVVELMGILTKPFALCMRLFANISAGHFMTLSLISLIFILGKNGESPAGGFGVSPLSVIFALFIFIIEVLVAAVQAFVFTLLTTVFISQAMESHDHGHDHEHAHAEGHH